MLLSNYNEKEIDVRSCEMCLAKTYYEVIVFMILYSAAEKKKLDDDFFQWTWFCCYIFYLFSRLFCRFSLCISLALLITLLPFMCSCFLEHCARRAFWDHSHSSLGLYNVICAHIYTSCREELPTLTQPHGTRREANGSEKIIFDWLVRSKKNKPHCYFACRNDNTLFWISPRRMTKNSFLLGEKGKLEEN